MRGAFQSPILVSLAVLFQQPVLLRKGDHFQEVHQDADYGRQAGQDQDVAVDGMNRSTVVYRVPARSSRRLKIAGLAATLTGSFVVTPDAGHPAPSMSRGCGG